MGTNVTYIEIQMDKWTPGTGRGGHKILMYSSRLSQLWKSCQYPMTNPSSNNGFFYLCSTLSLWILNKNPRRQELQQIPHSIRMISQPSHNPKAGNIPEPTKQLRTTEKHHRSFQTLYGKYCAPNINIKHRAMSRRGCWAACLAYSLGDGYLSCKKSCAILSPASAQ